MKKSRIVFRLFSLVCVSIMLLSCPMYAVSLDDSVSSKEIINLALFYYAMNYPEGEMIDVDSQVTTPLFDSEGNTTYYCVDFFKNQQSKGYVVIGNSLKQLLCTEISFDGVSNYYLNSQMNIRTIYYNPFSVYTLDEKCSVYYDQEKNKIRKENAVGVIFEGDFAENNNLVQLTSDVLMPEENQKSIKMDPLLYLQGLGFTNVYCDHYGTLQSTMQNAGAFNEMISVPKGEDEKYQVISLGSTGFEFSNPNHCAITAISNILLYWRYKVMPDLPSTYNLMFANVMSNAHENGYMSKYAKYDNDGKIILDGLNFEQAKIVLENVITKFGYDGSILSTEEADWDFLTDSIDTKMPVYLRFNENNVPDGETSSFVYDSHATVAYGYTVMNASTTVDAYQYRFVKLLDGWTKDNRYICWDMLEQSQFNFDYIDGEYIDRSIQVGMFAFYPYQ